jgi:hypothetical protein
MNGVGNYHIHFCLKCFDNKNVVVASLDIEIYSVVQGDTKTTNRLCQKMGCGFLVEQFFWVRQLGSKYIDWM